MEHERDFDTNCNWFSRKGHQRELDELKIGRRTETIQTVIILRSDRILRRVLET